MTEITGRREPPPAAERRNNLEGMIRHNQERLAKHELLAEAGSVSAQWVVKDAKENLAYAERVLAELDEESAT